MREIEFRGKDIETGKWVFGDLHTLCDNPHIHTEKSKFPYAGKRSFVIPETIGQFTGLLDKVLEISAIQSQQIKHLALIALLLVQSDDFNTMVAKLMVKMGRGDEALSAMLDAKLKGKD